MDGVLVLIAIISGLLAFGFLAVRFGVDSTYDSTDPHSPTAGLTV